MRDFWLTSGFHLLERDAAGRLRAGDAFLQAFFRRPELRPVDSTHEALVALTLDRFDGLDFVLDLSGDELDLRTVLGAIEREAGLTIRVEGPERGPSTLRLPPGSRHSITSQRGAHLYVKVGHLGG